MMMENIPVYIPVIFGLTTVLALIIFYWVIRNSNIKDSKVTALKITSTITIWLIIQAVFAANHIYSSNMDVMPPKIVLLGILPPMLTIIIIFYTRRGQNFIQNLNLNYLTYLNMVRIPVELVLYWLFLHHAVPEIMTFEGRNFDILAGLSSPFIAYFGVKNRKLMLGWNVISLCLLINIIVIAFLSAPTPLQQIAFHQPNIAVLYFPFSWLPTFIVPLVLFGHLASIRLLLKSSKW